MPGGACSKAALNEIKRAKALLPAPNQATPNNATRMVIDGAKLRCPHSGEVLGCTWARTMTVS